MAFSLCPLGLSLLQASRPLEPPTHGASLSLCSFPHSTDLSVLCIMKRSPFPTCLSQPAVARESPTLFQHTLVGTGGRQAFSMQQCISPAYQCLKQQWSGCRKGPRLFLLPVFTPMGIPSHTDCDPHQVTCFDHWDRSKCDTSKHLKSASHGMYLEGLGTLLPPWEQGQTSLLQMKDTWPSHLHYPDDSQPPSDA